LQLTDKQYQVLETIEIGKYGTLVDAKGAGNKIYLVFETDGVTLVYSYYTKTREFTRIYGTRYMFDISLSAEGYMFETFYSEDKVNEIAIMIDSTDDSFEVVYDDEIIPTYYGDDSNLEIVYREKEINQLLYKGNMLFGYHIDGAGVNTLIFYDQTIPTPEPTPTPTPTPTPEDAIISVLDITGIYTGTYENKSGEMNMTILIADDDTNGDNIVFGLVGFSPAEGNNHGVSGRYTVSGKIDVVTGYIVFTGMQWMEQPDGYEMLGFEGYIDSETLTGALDRDYLTKLVLFRYE